MRQFISVCERFVTLFIPGPYAQPMFRTELTKRRAIDLARVAAMLCRMP